MAQYRRILVVEDIAQIHRRYARVLTLLAAAERDPRLRGRYAGRRRQTQLAYANFQRGLNDVARHNATLAEKRMKQRFDQTRARANTGHGGLHLRQALRARPAQIGSRLATGAVGIADIEILNSVVNPASPQYGPFWRAQEYGTGFGEVPSQEGRVFRGSFYDRGYNNPTPPIAGRGDQPIFVSTRNARALAPSFSGSSRGGMGGHDGLGTIHREIQPRRFITNTIQDIEPLWRADINRVQGQAIASLRAIGL